MTNITATYLGTTQNFIATYLGTTQSVVVTEGAKTDLEPMSFSEVSISDIIETNANLNITASEMGTLFYGYSENNLTNEVVLTNGANTIGLSGLHHSTNYTVYYKGVDEADNETTVESIQFTTASPVLMPDFLKNAIFYYDSALSTYSDTGTLIINDLSNVGKNATQSNAANKPTVNASGITFGANHFLDIGETWISPYSFTIYFRINRALAADDYILYGNVPTGRHIQLMIRSGSIYFGFGGGGNVNTINIDNQYLVGEHLFRIDNNNNSVRIFIDGVLRATTPYTMSRTFGTIRYIGDPALTKPINGTISHLSIYNKFLDVNETAIVEAQIENKTAIPNYVQTSCGLVLQTGQSNAIGRKFLSDFPAQNQTNQLAKVLNCLTGQLKFVNEALNHGENLALDEQSLYKGFEIEYTRLLNQQNLYILKYGVGNTGMKNISGYNWNISATTPYWLTTYFSWYYKYFVDYLKSLGHSIDKKLSIRMQGENDAGDASKYAEFETNLTNWINYMRSMTGETTPHIECGIRPTVYTYGNQVKAAQQNVCEALSECYFIPTDNYTVFDSNIHYDVNGLLQGGTDIAQVITENELL